MKRESHPNSSLAKSKTSFGHLLVFVGHRHHQQQQSTNFTKSSAVMRNSLDPTCHRYFNTSNNPSRLLLFLSHILCLSWPHFSILLIYICKYIHSCSKMFRFAPQIKKLLRFFCWQVKLYTRTKATLCAWTGTQNTRTRCQCTANKIQQRDDDPPVTEYSSIGTRSNDITIKARFYLLA